MIIYKYLPLARIEDVIRHAAIRFSQPETLNDPFEYKPQYSRLQKSLKEIGINCDPIKFDKRAAETLGKIKEGMRIISQDTLVLCLSKKRNNLLMWSHYTDCYKGFVIGFDSNSPFFEPNSEGDTSVGLDVKYSNKRPKFPHYEEGQKDEVINKFFKKLITTKSRHWSYEKEIRFLATPKICRQIEAPLPKCKELTEKVKELPIYVRDFPRESVNEIIIGHRMPPGKRVTLLSILRAEYPTTHIFETRLSETDFDLEIQKL